MFVKSLAAAALVGFAIGRLNASAFATDLDGEAPPPPIPAPAVAQAAPAAKPTITIQAVPVVPPAAAQPADGASSPDRIHLVIHLATDAPPPQSPSQAATPSPQTPQAQPVMAPQAQPVYQAPAVAAPPHVKYPSAMGRAIGHLGDLLSRAGHVKYSYPMTAPVLVPTTYQAAAPTYQAPPPPAAPVYQAPPPPAKAEPAMASPQAPAKSGFSLFRR